MCWPLLESTYVGRQVGKEISFQSLETKDKEKLYHSHKKATYYLVLFEIRAKRTYLLIHLIGLHLGLLSHYGPRFYLKLGLFETIFYTL